MNLVWHIAKKDLRRMAAPVAVWLALILAGAIWFRTAEPSLVGHVASEIDEWGALVTIWSVLLTVAELMLAIVLTGALMLEDRVASPNAFWPTRPIGGGRLLAAKLLASFLCFIVAPVVVLTPVWLSVGCTFVDIVHAAVQFAVTFGFAVLFAMAVSSLVKGLGELALMVTVLGVGCWIALIPGMHGEGGALHVSVPMRVGLAALFGCAALYQFRTRRTLVGMIVLTGGLCVALVVAWRVPGTKAQSELKTQTRVRALPAPPAEVARTITTPATFWKPASPSYRMFTRIENGVYFAPGIARNSEGMSVLVSGAGWEFEVAKKALGLHGEPDIVWNLFPLGDPASLQRAPSLVGALDLWRVRPVVVGEIPLRSGASLVTSFGRVRIAALEESRGQLDFVDLEERDVAPAGSHDWLTPERSLDRADDWTTLKIDAYVAVDRRSNRIAGLWGGKLQARHNGQAVGYRRLKAGGMRDWEGMSLVKVRLECERVYELPINVHGVTAEPPRQRGEGTPPTTEVQIQRGEGAPPTGRRISNIQH